MNEIVPGLVLYDSIEANYYDNISSGYNFSFMSRQRDYALHNSCVGDPVGPKMSRQLVRYSGPLFTEKTPSYCCRDSSHKTEVVARPSFDKMEIFRHARRCFILWIEAQVSELLLQLISLWTKWPPFRRWFFQTHFREWKILYLD